jgi:DNA-directed RNA polymerase specialized sigma24 family protein
VALPPFQALLDAHGHAVHRFLVASVGPVDADDCYQETWLAALRAYPRLTDASHLRGWVMTIAHHKAIDHVRAQARRAVPVPDVETSAAPPDVERFAAPPGGAGPGPDPIWAGVAALPAKQRTAVALRYLGDLSHAEIGAAMQISEAAARRNVHEGLTRLREEYRT